MRASTSTSASATSCRRFVPRCRRDAIRVVLIDGRISHVAVETDPEQLARRGAARLDARYAENRHH
jgi:hypothetical protein